MRSLGSEIHRFAPFPLSFSIRKRKSTRKVWQFIYQFLQGTCSLPWISTNPNLHDPSCPTWHPWYPELFASSLGVSLQELVVDAFRTWTASPFASKNDIDIIYKSERIHLSSIYCLKYSKMMKTPSIPHFHAEVVNPLLIGPSVRLCQEAVMKSSSVRRTPVLLRGDLAARNSEMMVVR